MIRSLRRRRKPGRQCHGGRAEADAYQDHDDPLWLREGDADLRDGTRERRGHRGVRRPRRTREGLGLCNIRQELERRGGNREGPGRCSIRQEGCGIRQDELGSRRTRESPGRRGGIRQEPGLRDTHQWGRHTRETD